MRSTTKYWVRTTDVSAVKHHILQHLPVFQFEKSVRTHLGLESTGLTLFVLEARSAQ